MKSPWSREDDAADRMESVVREQKADSYQRLKILEAKCAQVAELLRDVVRYSGNLSGEECVQLADMLDEACGGVTGRDRRFRESA